MTSEHTSIEAPHDRRNRRGNCLHASPGMDLWTMRTEAPRSPFARIGVGSGRIHAAAEMVNAIGTGFTALIVTHPFA